MSSSAHSSLNSRHRLSRKALQPRRNISYSRKHVTDDNAYSYALRAAYLAYLLLPRQKRVQHVANTSKPIQRSYTSINDMVKDFSLIRDSKSTKFPHGFMAELDKRITGVLMKKEKMPEYNDPQIKRTFAAFLNQLKDPTWFKSMEKDRKVEDLLLIFFSKATAELRKGKEPDDESWKLMVDRHVALFVRIISSTLQNNDWTRERPELSSRLKTMEQKLLQHDQDLSVSTKSIEVEVPRSYEVKDMPLVIRVCRVFAKSTVQAQSDINAHRDEWTEQAALRDLKEYQNNMMLGTHVTLTKDDFDLDEAYELWKKGEITDLGEMILAILKSNPELAKTSSRTAAAPLNLQSPISSQNDSGFSELGRILSNQSADIDSSYVFDQPVDMSSLNLGDSSPIDSGRGSMDAARANFTFVPPDPRAYYRLVLKHVLMHDLHDEDLTSTQDTIGAPAGKLLSKPSTEMLDEIATRWRIPQFSRMVLFLDVVREKYQDEEITSTIIDNAFLWVKQPPSPLKKGPGKVQQAPISLFDRSKWTIQDYAMIQGILSAIHDALLRELFELFQQCYENKPPSIGSIMYVLENHIYDDELFNKTPEDLDGFSASLAEALKQKAQSKYHEILSKHVSDDANTWEFYYVIQLGQAVTGLCAKIQKRYRKNPEVMGVNPLTILVEEILPSFADDARALVRRILELAKKKDEEVPIQDGFELYKELIEIRRVHAQALPGKEFGFHIEGLLQEFVWRWIQMTDSKIIDWIEGAVAQDDFQVRQDEKEKEQGLPPTEEERHSQSPVDVYRIFTQSIEQIVKLEWDDDLQYAKFMTAISKSIERGVTRYCELLEAKFAREMDRQTPEQEMRSQQSQKERWIAYAKDVYQSGGKGGEKIEPFQFWPESFVKINNIEYATLQLDKLEKEIAVDACADVINRLDPPKPQSMRRAGETKYMFTIKIIEAEDLKAGDINGLSDPYVVLGDEYSKRLAKTRTVYQSLNPRWDETVDILTTGPLNVIATVWDWDMMGDHDCLGRTTLKLDPTHFNDYVPREYWLDLDTQGRVLVRVSMEGERDDIQFHFGKAFRTLRRAEKEMTRKTTDKLSAYIHQCLSRRTLRSLLGQGMIGGVTISGMKSFVSKVSGRPTSVVSPVQATPAATQADITNSLKPLLNYFDDNFAIMKLTLTESAMVSVMTRLWKEVLVIIEGLLVPPLSDKPSAQRPLGQQEVDIVYKWLQILFDFFHAVDEGSGVALGVPLDILKSPKYHDLQNLNFFYFESTNNLIRTSETMASATANRQQDSAARLNRLSTPSGLHGMHSSAGLLSACGTRRTKSVMMSRNLGTMKKAKEEKRKEAQADPNDDMILRILRMRPEAERYIKDRNRQKDRLAAHAAAEAIVIQSLQASRGTHASAGASLGRRWETIRE